MAKFYCLMKEDPIYPVDLIKLYSGDENSRSKERLAAIKIQSWFRSIQIQIVIRRLTVTVLKIQKYYRGYVGRKMHQKYIQDRLENMKMIFYDKMAIKIQSRWRGYYVRKYKANYYARKNYLTALTIKNENVRKHLEELAITLEWQKNEEKRIAKEKEERLRHRKTHYMLSTSVRDGIFKHHDEQHLRSFKPFSRQERARMHQQQQRNILRSSTGIPATDSIPTEGLPNKMLPIKPLPPIKKPQGPFNEPEEVRNKRYKQLQPTLRVATDYQSVEKARLVLRNEEWSSRINDKTFLPSTKRRYSYCGSLNASSVYGHLDYGTQHFRTPHDEKNIHNKSFQRVVSPIPIFDNLQTK